MLWRKKTRSPSPSRLISSTPQLERHLVAMEDSDPNAAAPPGYAPPTVAEDIPAALTTEDSAEACKSSQEAPLPKDHATNAPTVPESNTAPKRKRVISETAKLSRPRILILLACVSYVLFHLMGLHLGLQLIKGYIEPRLQLAKTQKLAATVGLIYEDAVEHKYDVLLGTTLEPRYLEDYEHCLARGIREADKVFQGLDFTQSSQVRNSTMDWVTNNCDRLAFTPQVYNPNISNPWLAMHRARQAALEAISLLKHQVAILRSRLLNEKPLKSDTKPSTATHFRLPVAMPHGFAADCEGRSRCRLIFTDCTKLKASRETFEKAHDKADKEVKKWDLPIKQLLHVNWYIVLAVLGLQALIAYAYVIAGFLERRPQLPPSKMLCRTWMKRLPSLAWQKLTMPHEDDLVFFGCYPNVFLYVLLNTQVEYIISELGAAVLPVGLAVLAFHWFGTLGFLNHHWHKNSNESLHALTRVIKDLYLIARGIDVPEVPNLPQTTPKPTTLCTRTSTSAQKPASKVGAKFISPLTPISEDLQQERKAMHAEQGKQTAGVELEGYATESEDEYESDEQGAGYVDLAGGATPTVSEDEGEWAVVEE